MNVYAIPGITRTIGEAAIDFRLRPDQIFRKIEYAICNVWGIEPARLYKKTRERGIVEVRQLVYWHMIRHTNLSLVNIGLLYGQDHATVLHAKKVVNHLRETNKLYRARFEQAEAEIQSLVPYGKL